MAQMPLPHSMTVTRLTQSGVNKEVYTQVAVGIKCFVQPASPDKLAAFGDATFTKGFVCYIDHDANVRVKDKLLIGDKLDTVKGEYERGYGTSWPHRVLGLEQL